LTNWKLSRTDELIISLRASRDGRNAGQEEHRNFAARLSAMSVCVRSNHDNDLADLSARFEITMRIDNLVEWKDSVDDWFQRALF
jgi:hypothetical protein